MTPLSVVLAAALCAALALALDHFSRTGVQVVTQHGGAGSSKRAQAQRAAAENPG